MRIQKPKNLSKQITDTLFPPPRFKAFLSCFPSQVDLLRRQAEVREEESEKLPQAADSRGSLESKGLRPYCWLAWFQGSPAELGPGPSECPRIPV